jgi:hypothetical protein
MCLLVSPAIAQDFQLWDEVDLTASWKKVEFLAPFLARTDTSLPNPQLAATGITADFPLPWRLTLKGGYLFVDLPQRALFVHLALVALTKSGTIGRFTFADRNRFEKLVGFGTSPVRYRNRLLVDRAFGAHDAGIGSPAMRYFSIRRPGAWNQNRQQAGGGALLNRCLLLDVYYLQRNARGPAPTTRVLGTTLRVTLTPKLEGAHPRR